MKFIKPLLKVFLALAWGSCQFTISTASAEGRVGNGGGTVVCRNANHVIQSVELLDFYEARTIHNLKIDIQSFPGSWQDKAKAVLARIQPKSDFHYQLYSNWLSTFFADSKILNGVQFSTIPDSGYIGMPDGCEFEQAAIQRQPMFPGDARYFLNSELWDAMDDNQKAGLALHEIIYREAIGYGHTTSIRSRYLTATYASSSFEKMSIPDYWKILIDANFETTDRALPPEAIGSIQTVVNTTRLTQPGPTDPISSSLTIKDRIMVQLGYCDAGCQNFTPANNRDLPSPPGIAFENILSTDTLLLTFVQKNPLDNITARNIASDVFYFYDGNSTVGAQISVPTDSAFIHHDLFMVHQNARSSFYETDPATVWSFGLVKTSSQDWQWASYTGITLAIASPGSSFADLDLFQSSDICNPIFANFKNNVLVSFKQTSAGSIWPHCANSTPQSKSLIGNLFANGFSRVLLSTIASPNQLVNYEPDHPYALANPQADLYTWSSLGNTFTPGLATCGACGEANVIPDPANPNPCMRPVIDANNVVQSLLVIDHSPQLTLDNVVWPYAAVGSSIQLDRALGGIKTFVTRDPIQWDHDGQATLIPANATVTLQGTTIVSFQQ